MPSLYYKNIQPPLLLNRKQKNEINQGPDRYADHNRGQ